MRPFGLLLPLLLVAGGDPSRPPVTPVVGPSWIERLGVALEDTRMGRMGGQEPPPPGVRREPMPMLDGGREAGERSEPFTIFGRDLYRLDCRSCHGPRGLGALPEIHSLLDPVRATSPELLEERERRRGPGRHLPPGMAKQLAADARRALLDRIENGGKRMPAFPHLRGEEVTALVAYLQALAGVPAARRPEAPVTESASRAGEHLVKGTCHVCHPAAGPDVNPMMMYMRGVIPSLASIRAQLQPDAVLAKVRAGRASMGMMGGGMGMMGRGMGMMGHTARMPVLRYLTEEEVAAAYLYLGEFPPQPE
ncbi:MAG TPA: cytochrome c [Anaeromyxobacter sp.]